MPPRSTAVPSKTAEIGPTQRDRHLQLVAEHGRTERTIAIEGQEGLYGASLGRHSDMVLCGHAPRAPSQPGRPAGGPASPNVVAAMPGQISAIEVTSGQRVERGDTVVMEAMKMLLRLTAPLSGRVTGVFCSMDQVVGTGAVLLSLEPET